MNEKINFPFPCFSKIQQYSPTDSSKAFDRQVNRRPNMRFEPKATLEILKRGDPPENLSDEDKEELVNKYLEVSFLSNFVSEYRV